MEKWTPEQLNNQTERAKSDAKLIEKGAVYVQDKNAQEPRLHLHDDALEIAYDENTKLKIEKKELIHGDGIYSTVLNKISDLANKKGIRLEKKVYEIFRDLPAGTPSYQQSAVYNFLKAYGGEFISVESGRNLIALRCCYDSDCTRSHTYELSNEDKKELEKAYKTAENPRKFVADEKEVIGRMQKVDLLSKEDFSEFVEKMAEKILANIMEEEKEEKARIERRNAREKEEKINKFDPSI